MFTAPARSSMTPEDPELEHNGEDMDEAGADPVNFWEKKQRELFTSMVDYNLGSLADLLTAKKIDLAPKYQRRDRWDPARQSKLIESFLMNVPVPPVFLNEDKYGKYSVIDGKQRLTAIHEFMRGRLSLTGLKVFSDINGKNFDQLPPDFQDVVRVRPQLRVIIVLRQSDEDIKFEVFKRLNTGGVKLNPQEIRNSTYPGPFNDLLLELSEAPEFHKLLAIKDKKKSAIYQEMRDVELVLRYFTFFETWATFEGGMMRHMDKTMVRRQRASAEEIKALKQDFLQTLEVVDAAFGEHAFRRYSPENQKWRSQVVAAIYDAQMFACRGLSADALRPRRQEIIAAMENLFAQDEFRKVVDAATNTPSFFRRRIEMVREMLTAKLG